MKKNQLFFNISVYVYRERDKVRIIKTPKYKYAHKFRIFFVVCLLSGYKNSLYVTQPLRFFFIRTKKYTMFKRTDNKTRSSKQKPFHPNNNNTSNNKKVSILFTLQSLALKMKLFVIAVFFLCYYFLTGICIHL